MTPGNLAQGWDVALRLGSFDVADPGASGTIVINNKARAYCLVSTSGAETRKLEDAANLAVGTELTVIFIADGGNLTLDSDDTDVVLVDVGDFATFVVVNNGSSNVWKLVARSGLADVSLADLADLDLSSAPISVTGARDDGTALASLLTALATIGLITDNSTET